MNINKANGLSFKGAIYPNGFDGNAKKTSPSGDRQVLEAWCNRLDNPGFLKDIEIIGKNKIRLKNGPNQDTFEVGLWGASDDYQNVVITDPKKNEYQLINTPNPSSAQVADENLPLLKKMCFQLKEVLDVFMIQSFLPKK